MPTPDAQRLMDCRFQTRRALYAKPTAALDVDSIRHTLTRWGEDFTNSEIKAAATFLCGLEPAEARLMPKRMGAIDYWQITPAGMVAYETNA